MRYLLLAYPHAEPAQAGATESEPDAFAGWPGTAGTLMAGGPLRAAAAVTVRLPAGDLVSPDGPGACCPPPAPTGFWLVEARDLNHAVRLASQLPPVLRGCVQIHPLADAEPPTTHAQTVRHP